MTPLSRRVSPARHRPRLRGILALAAILSTYPARAESTPADPGEATKISKPECAQAFEQSQRLRNAFRYLDASTEALRCASSQCGVALSEECGRLYSDLQAATPSIVLRVRSNDGTELDSVIVTIDDDERSATVDGTPLLLDPGNHRFTFTADGFQPSELTAVISAGERFRMVVGVLTKLEPVPTAAPPTEHDQRELRRIPVASYVLGGVGLAGFASFVGFRVAGANEYDALAHDCKPTCSQGSIDAARQKYVISYVGLAVGAAASVAAVTVYLASPRKPTAQHATLQLRPIASGVAAHFTAAF